MIKDYHLLCFASTFSSYKNISGTYIWKFLPEKLVSFAVEISKSWKRRQNKKDRRMVGQQELKSIFNHIEQYEKSKKKQNWTI